MERRLDNMRFYQILGLKRTDALPEEIKRAYRRLSLRYHPDRNLDDPTTTAKFQEVAQAYDTLSSPRKRQIYDAYGVQGLQMYESYMSFTDSGEGRFPVQPVTMVMLVCFLISFIVLVATAVALLLLLKLDGTLSASLTLVLLPAWVLDAMVFCCLCVAMMGGTQRADLALNALALLGVTAFLALLCVAADGVAPLSYAVVFVPLFALEALRTAQARP